MKNLTDILSQTSTNEIRFTGTNIEIWTKRTDIKVEDLEVEKKKYNNILQLFNSLEEDYTTLVLLIKICKSCQTVNQTGLPLLAADIKAFLLKSITDEYGARDYLLTEHTTAMAKLNPIEELPKEIVEKE
jgi:hypothetical protein